MTNTEILEQLSSLSVFRDLLSDPVIEALIRFLEASGKDGTRESVSAYSEFAGKLFRYGNGNLTEHIKNILNSSENVYIRSFSHGSKPDEILIKNAESELRILQKIAEMTPQFLRSMITYTGYLPSFASDRCSLVSEYNERCSGVSKFGYGIYAANIMFYLDDGGKIVPVNHPDRIRLSDLVDYDYEKSVILKNTRALLNGKPAANMLLSGDAGTGKSSMVKAVVNELCGDGLRILQLRKSQLKSIPLILDTLSENPLKFILFIDDLSFTKDDDNYSALKATLEGSVSAKSPNVVIYATSNRRHIVKESFSQREGDDIHRNDTIQELMSLSDRFGLHLTFTKPTKKIYLGIVKHLAESAGITADDEALFAGAERFALERGSRSARTARQYVDSLISGT